MVKHCAWGECKSDSRYADREHMKGVGWIPFPKPFSQPEKCRRWVSLCGRKGFSVSNVNKATYICSKHFVEGGPTDEYPDPLPASGTPHDVRKSLKKRRKSPVVREGTPLKSNPKRKKLFNDIPLPEVAAFDEIETSTDVVEITEENNEFHHDHPYSRPAAGVTLGEKVDQSCQTEVMFQHLSRYEDCHLQDVGSLKRHLIMSDVLKNEESCKFYTGLSLSLFLLIFNMIRSKAARMTYWRGADSNFENDQRVHKGPPRAMKVKEEMCMTLIRLRRGIDVVTLSNLFGITSSTFRKIFFTWISFLYLELKFLISWPSREQIISNLPKCFKQFPKTRCIIDCTEIFIQKPSLPSSQRITWSSYKHHNTFKTFVGITPTGTFSFISNLFTGSVSDKRIVEESGFLNFVERGDDIMADRGFLIRGELALKGATLNIPPFSFNKQLSGIAVTKTRRIARARIHVERAIGRLKCFTSLQSVIPIKLRPIMDQIVVICAALCNLDTKLVK